MADGSCQQHGPDGGDIGGLFKNVVDEMNGLQIEGEVGRPGLLNILRGRRMGGGLPSTQQV
jgi:hypothetical protein